MYLRLDETETRVRIDSTRGIMSETAVLTSKRRKKSKEESPKVDNIFHQYANEKDEKKKIKLKKQIATENIGLINHTIKKYFPYVKKSEKFNDLVAEGMLGMMRAIEKFEPERDIKFSTYAVPWIRQAVRKYLNTRALNIPVNSGPANMLWRYKQIYGDKPVNEITVSEIMDNEFVRKGASQKSVKNYLDQLNYRPCSADSATKKLTSTIPIAPETSMLRLKIGEFIDALDKAAVMKLINYCELEDESEESSSGELYDQLMTEIFKVTTNEKPTVKHHSKPFREMVGEVIYLVLNDREQI